MIQNNLSIIGSDPWALWRTIALKNKGLNVNCFFQEEKVDGAFYLSDFEIKLLKKAQLLPDEIANKFKMTAWDLKTSSCHLYLGRNFPENLQEIKRKTQLADLLSTLDHEEIRNLLNTYREWILHLNEKKNKERHQLWAKNVKASDIFQDLKPSTKLVDLKTKEEIINLCLGVRIRESHWIVYDLLIEEILYSLSQILFPWFRVDLKTLLDYQIYLLKNQGAIHFNDRSLLPTQEIFINEENLKKYQILGYGQLKKISSNPNLLESIQIDREPWSHGNAFFNGYGREYLWDTSLHRPENFLKRFGFPFKSTLSIQTLEDTKNKRMLQFGGPLKYRQLGRVSYILQDLIFDSH